MTEYDKIRSEIFDNQIKEIINQLEEIEALIEDNKEGIKNRLWNFVSLTINDEITILRS